MSVTVAVVVCVVVIALSLARLKGRALDYLCIAALPVATVVLVGLLSWTFWLEPAIDAQIKAWKADIHEITHPTIVVPSIGDAVKGVLDR